MDLPGDFEELEGDNYDGSNQFVNDPNNVAGDSPEGGAELRYFKAEIAGLLLICRQVRSDAGKFCVQ